MSTDLEFVEEELNTGLGGWVVVVVIMPPRGPTSKIARN